MAADLLNERLPPDWSYGVTGDGRVFFISERHRETTWLHPVTGRPVQTGHQAAPGLPQGWEQDYTPEGVTYFINHNHQQTSFGHPVTGRPVSEENPPPPPRSPPQSPHDRSDLRRGTTNSKQRSIKAPSAKRNPNAQVIRRGFLYRLESGGISRSWKRRWCVLADFALFIYKSDDEKSPLGSVLLPSYRINRCTVEDPVQKEFAFKVEHENTKTAYFHTDTQTDLDSWLSNLQMAATMKGNSGFYREANNNNIKPGVMGSSQRSPAFEDQRRDYPSPSHHSPQDSDPRFHPQWRNPNHDSQQDIFPGPDPARNSFSGQPPWRSVQDVDRDSRRSRGPGEYDPQGSLRSLPQDVNRNQSYPLGSLQPESRNYPHHQSYDPRLGQPRADERDPRGSVRSLQADPYTQSRGFVPLGQMRGSERDRGSYTQPGFSHQRPDDPQHRSSMVSDSGQRFDSAGSPQRSSGEANVSHGSIPGVYQLRQGPQNSLRSEGSSPYHNRQTSEDSARNRDSTSWHDNSSGPASFHSQLRDSASYPEHSRDNPASFHSQQRDSASYPEHSRDNPASFHSQLRDSASYPEHSRDNPASFHSQQRDSASYPEHSRDNPASFHSQQRDSASYPEHSRDDPASFHSQQRDSASYPEHSRDDPASFHSRQRDSATYPEHSRDDPASFHSRQRDSLTYPEHSRDNPASFHSQQRDSASYPEHSREYTDPRRNHRQMSDAELSRDPGRDRDRFYPEIDPRLSISRDPRTSFASSRHSVASQNYAGDRDLGSKQNLFPGSRNSLSRTQVGSYHPHDPHGHTYVNVPEMQGRSQYRDDSPPPERPPYPVAVRDQIVRDLAEAQSPGTAEKLLTAHELNKERMQRTPFFQYPTPPRDNMVSRLDDSRSSDMVKRLSQYSDRNSFASNQAVRNDQGQQGPPRNDFNNTRRQDSESSRFADSFERHSTEDPRVEDAGQLGLDRPLYGEAAIPEERRFGGDPEAKTLRQAYERVQSFRQSSAANGPVFDGSGVQQAVSQSDVNFFEYSLNSQISARSFFAMSNPGFSVGQGIKNGEITDKLNSKPQSGAWSGDIGFAKDDLDVSQNPTLSPCGSYHHIDWNPDQLYQRGSAFRPPSFASGSFCSDGRFHSLPRSYKFKSPPGIKKDLYSREHASSGKMTDDGADSGTASDWEWYKARYLSPAAPGNSDGIGQAGRSEGQPRKAVDVDMSRKSANGQQPLPGRVMCETDVTVPTTSRTAPYFSRGLASSCNQGHVEGKKDVQKVSAQKTTVLQSWPRQELKGRESDVATPCSINAHPFFVPEEPCIVPEVPDTTSHTENLTPRTVLDRKLRQDLDEGVYATLKAREGMNRRPIQTVREEPDMPDSEVLETKVQKKYPLNGTRLRMSISAGDLIGKTHDELVLLLIQLRRNQAALEKARDFYRESLSKQRPAEREYRKQRHDSVGRLERSLEEGHQSFVDIRSQLEEVENKLEVYRPLINLVDNMVTMGSLYGGDNLMLATQYRKHLLRPDQYQAPRKMLEFSRQHQEKRVVSGIQNDVRQLTAAEVDLEEKIDRLNQLERLLQEQSFKVSSFREDKELLEKTLVSIQQQMRRGQDSPRELHKLQQQQHSVEKELSRVTQELAEASKALEETTVENNKIEHEVALLRTKVHGELKRSKSAPSLATDSANTKVKMERELAKVQNMLQGLSQQGEKLSQQMSTIRRSSSGTQLAAAFDEAEKSRKVGTYMQTDLDSGQQVDLAQQIPVQSPSSSLTPTSPFTTAGSVEQPLISHQRQESTHGTNGFVTEGDTQGDWDIGDADDNTKRFYGLLPRERPKSLTVRDVKRQSEQRRERKRDEEGQDIALKVSSTDDDTSTFIHARYPSYTSSQSSGLDLSAGDSSAPLYENLPRAGSLPALNLSGSAAGSRRSSISLLAPKPFTPYQDRTAKPFRSDLSLNSTNHSGDFAQESDGTFATSRPFTTEMESSGGWGSSLSGNVQSGGDRSSQASGQDTSFTTGQMGVHNSSFTAGQVGVATAHPFLLGRSTDNIPDLHQPGVTRSLALPTYTRVPQPFRRPDWGVSQSTPHLNTLESAPSSLPPFTGVSRPVMEGGDTSRVYAPRPWAMERANVQPGLYDVKKSPKGRYMTISSSQPVKMESGTLMNTALHSSAGDLLSNATVDDVPDVVKSSINNVDKLEHVDQDMIDREILYFPEKVLIPERYDAEADAEHLTEAQRAERLEKAERIKRLLTNQSVLSMSQPDVNQIPSARLHSHVEREKEERAHFLTLTQELARQVTQQSKKAAAERRKTWSGGQIADIKAQYEAEMAGSAGHYDRFGQSAHQANILL